MAALARASSWWLRWSFSRWPSHPRRTPRGETTLRRVSYVGTPSGPSSAGFSGHQTTTHVSPGVPGTSGSSTPSGTSGGTSSGYSTPLWTGDGGGDSCDPALYPNGYSPGLALPAPCIQPTGGGRAPTAPGAAGDHDPDGQVTPPPRRHQRLRPTSSPATRSDVNIPNNYWTDAPSVRTSVNVLGRAIPLTWTPTGTTWDFGDGVTATGTGIVGAAPGAPGAVEHAYEQQGTYDITTSTTYDLTFVLPGQGAQTIQLTSPPSARWRCAVGEIQTRVSYAH